MSARVRDVMAMMERIAPAWLAAEGDRVGLHAGDPARKVRRVLVALDATQTAVRAARERKCQMIVTHHPRFFRPLETLDESTPMGALAAAIVRAKLAVFCAHTNLDAAPGGVNDALAELVGLAETRPIRTQAEDEWRKLVVFVPESHVEAVRTAVCAAGAGAIGEYTDCSFCTAGVGTFRGAEATRPYVGTAGRFEEAEEWRLETVLTEHVQSAVVRALLAAHPYEEPAFDLYPLEAADAFGCGRVGALQRPLTLGTLARRLKQATGSTATRALGARGQKWTHVAVWSGAGCPIDTILGLGVDGLVVGEIGYHETEWLEAAGIGCIALGHGPCEAIVLPRVAESLREGLPDVEVEVFADGTPKMWSV